MSRDSQIPTAPLLLGLAGLIPFVWGAVTVIWPGLGLWTAQTLSPRLAGPYVGLFYGTVILSFMSGVLWGFASKTTGRVAATGYALSTLPALWAFFMVGGGPVSAGISLIAGFIGLLGLDYMFWKQGLAPDWWMNLRLMLSVVVVASLAIPLI